MCLSVIKLAATYLVCKSKTAMLCDSKRMYCVDSVENTLPVLASFADGKLLDLHKPLAESIYFVHDPTNLN